MVEGTELGNRLDHVDFFLFCILFSPQRCRFQSTMLDLYCAFPFTILLHFNHDHNKNIQSFSALGDAVGSDSTSNGPRPRPGENATRIECDTRGPRQEPKPRNGVPWWACEPYGGGPQTQSSRYFRSHAGREGRTNATFCGEKTTTYIFFPEF